MTHTVDITTFVKCLFCNRSLPKNNTLILPYINTLSQEDRMTNFCAG